MKAGSNARQKKVPVLSTKDHRTALELQPGDRFIVRLPVNLEIGYRWKPDMAPGLKVIDSWFGPADLARPLAGGFHYWKIRAVSPGRHFYRATHWRQDNVGNFPPIIFQLQINVSGE